MTREQKIKNIIEATAAAVERAKENGTLTSEMHAAMIACQNSAIAAIN